MRWFLLLVVLVGCGESGELAAMRTALENASESVVAEQKATAEKTDEAVSILKENTAALTRIEKQLEASLSAPKPNGQEVIKSAPEPPAKANDTQTPLKVATPGAFRTASDGTRLRWNIEGNWNPTILETSAHLGKEHGINTDGMTHQEMADIHAALHDGKTEEQAVTGAMFQRNRASAIVSKQNPVRFVSRRGSVVQWQNYSTQPSCPSGRCPQRR